MKFPLVGLDEVGRGCLAGPVMSCAILWKSPEDAIVPEDWFSEIRDSKRLSERQRERLAEKIQSRWVCRMGSASVEEIDRLNILQASLLSMARTLKGWDGPSPTLLIDGNQKIRQQHFEWTGLSGGSQWEQYTLIGGDAQSPLIAAASIVAKVHRDRLMKALEKEFPGYGFASHKGYGSEFHRKALAKLGVTLWHRKSFSGVKELVSSSARA
ncbi:MAG: ribonuclease HII [Bdellovibrio sp.]